MSDMKVLFTSNFAKNSNHPKAVAITAHRPIWAKDMMHCAALAPTWRLVKAYKTGAIDAATYTKRYLLELGGKALTPQQVADTLPEGAVLLCYEKLGEFCHRHLAAEWLRQGANVRITELL